MTARYKLFHCVHIQYCQQCDTSQSGAEHDMPASLFAHSTYRTFCQPGAKRLASELCMVCHHAMPKACTPKAWLHLQLVVKLCKGRHCLHSLQTRPRNNACGLTAVCISLSVSMLALSEDSFQNSAEVIIPLVHLLCLHFNIEI